MKDLNDLSNKEKTALSFLLALTVPWMIALIVNFFLGAPFAMLMVGIALTAWTMVGGFQKNGELEESIGGVFGKMTSWVIPSGISWWIPRPLGQALRKISIERESLDKRSSTGNPFTQVKTRDGGIVEVGVMQAWHVSNARRAANYSQEGLKKQVEALLDRAVRFYALYFDSDEGRDPDDNTALSHRKSEFSTYLMGGVAYDRTGVPIPNDLLKKAAELGITVDSVDVTDVNEPKVVQEARNKAAAEEGQAIAERKDIESVRNRVLELMWGTSNAASVSEKMNEGQQPLMPYDDALRAVRAARGDLEDINVSGGGDFAKGAAIQRRPAKTK